MRFLGGSKNGGLTVDTLTFFRWYSTVVSIWSVVPGFACSLLIVANAMYFFTLGDHAPVVACPT
jgi:hypothetical protein